LYIADLFNNRVRFINTGITPFTLYKGGPNAIVVPPGYIISVAGTGVAGGSGDGGAAVSAQIDHPRAIQVDALGHLYIGEGGVGAHPTSRVRKVDPQTGVITTVAGTGQAGYNGDNIPATQAMLNGPRGLAIDRNGNLFIADTLNQRVRRVDGITQMITTVVGTGTVGFSGDGGPPASATMFYPRYVAVDSGNRLYVTDQGNSRIRRVILA
jgi:sugar lactone lactonase YvrE